MTILEVRNAVNGMGFEEVPYVQEAVRARYKQIWSEARGQFKFGDRVEFTDPRVGPVQGLVFRVNKKTLGIELDAGREARVPFALCPKIDEDGEEDSRLTGAPEAREVKRTPMSTELRSSFSVKPVRDRTLRRCEMNAKEVMSAFLDHTRSIEVKQEIVREFVSKRSAERMTWGVGSKEALRLACRDLHNEIREEDQERAIRIVAGFQAIREREFNEKKRQLALLCPGSLIQIFDGVTEKEAIFLQLNRTRFVCLVDDGGTYTAAVESFVRTEV